MLRGRARPRAGVGSLGALALLSNEADGIAIDATSARNDLAVAIRDTGTPSNDYDGSIYGLLASTFYPSQRLCVQQDGSLKWQQHQLLTGAKLFDNGAYWAVTTTTITALTAEADGEVPYQMAATSTTSRVQQNPTVIDGAWYSCEFVVKAGTSNRCYITFNTDGSNPRAYFLLSGAGTVTSSTAGLTAEISTNDVDGRPLPADRYRLVVRGKMAGTTLNMALGQCDADGSTDVTSGRTLKVYRSHLYYGVKSLEFMDATTSAVRGVPYDWTHGVKALLVEQMMTRYRSVWGDDLTQAEWVDTNITAALDSTGPHGEPCSTITATAGNGTILQTTATASTVHTMTAWVKRKTGAGKLYAQINGDTQEVTGISSTEWKRVKYTRTGASAVAEFGFKIETSGDEFYVSLVKVADQAFATSDLTTHGDVPTQRNADVPGIPLTRFPSGAEMTAYFDFHAADDMPTANEIGVGFETSGGDYATVSVVSGYARASVSDGGTVTFTVLGDHTAGDRVEAALRVAANDHGGSINGFGAGYDQRAGSPTVDTLTFGGAGGPLWLRRLLVVNRALADDELERWRYSGATRDARYLDDVIVARHAEAVDVLTQREPGLGKFTDTEDEATGFVTWVEKNVTAAPGAHVEQSGRIRGRLWTVNKVSKRITLGSKVTLVEPTDWASGLGHVHSPTIIKRTIGADAGRVWLLWTQLDTADGLLTPDHRRIYAAYSDDDLATLSTPEVVYDRGAGTYAIPSPPGNSVEFPAGSANPGRIVVPFYADGGDTHGVLYCDAGSTTWTLGDTVDVSTANEPTLALRPDGTLLMTMRTENVDEHYEVVISDSGTSFGTPALIASGSFTNTALSLSQMDPEGEEGTYGRMLLVGSRASSPFARSGYSIEELEGQPVVPSGTQFRPLGSVRMTGYASSMALSGGLMLAGYEDSAGNSFNDRCSVRLMLVRP